MGSAPRIAVVATCWDGAGLRGSIEATFALEDDIHGRDGEFYASYLSSLEAGNVHDMTGDEFGEHRKRRTCEDPWKGR